MLPVTVFEIRISAPGQPVDSRLQPGLPSAVLSLARARRADPKATVDLYVNGHLVPCTTTMLDKKALAKAIANG